MVAANGFDVGGGTDLRFLCNGGADWPFQFICDKLNSRYPNQKYRAEAFYALAILVNNSEPKNQALYDQRVAQYYRLMESADAESAAGNLTLPQEEQVKIAALMSDRVQLMFETIQKALMPGADVSALAATLVTGDPIEGFIKRMAKLGVNYGVGTHRQLLALSVIFFDGTDGKRFADTAGGRNDVGKTRTGILDPNGETVDIDGQSFMDGAVTFYCGPPGADASTQVFGGLLAAYHALKNVYVSTRDGQAGSLHVSDYKTVSNHGPFHRKLPPCICALMCKVIDEDRATKDNGCYQRDPSYLLLHTNGAGCKESSNVTKFVGRLFRPLNVGDIGTTVIRKALATDAAQGNAATIVAMQTRLKNSLAVFFRHYVHAPLAHEAGLAAGGGATPAAATEDTESE
jgi:hypothetical protein